MNKKIQATLIVLCGLAFVFIAYVYFRTPAGSLPGFFPGFESGSDHIHLKHGIAAALIAIGLFVYAWFVSGEVSKNTEVTM